MGPVQFILGLYRSGRLTVPFVLGLYRTAPHTVPFRSVPLHCTVEQKPPMLTADYKVMEPH